MVEQSIGMTAFENATSAGRSFNYYRGGYRTDTKYQKGAPNRGPSKTPYKDYRNRVGRKFKPIQPGKRPKPWKGPLRPLPNRGGQFGKVQPFNKFGLGATKAEQRSAARALAGAAADAVGFSSPLGRAFELML